MSGLYIDGIKMPKTDKAIHLEIHSDGTVIEWRYGDSDKIVSTAIPVPDHGRLIDADALEEKTDDRYSFGEIGRRQRDDIVGALQYCASTIIPASKEAGE